MKRLSPWEEEAEGLVTAACKTPGGPWFVQLGKSLGQPLYLGPYQNPAVAREEAEKVRRIFANVIRTTLQAREDQDLMASKTDWHRPELNSVEISA